MPAERSSPLEGLGAPAHHNGGTMQATTRITLTLDFERAARQQWLGNAAHVHFGVCGRCFHHHRDGKPLLVARQPRRQVFECLDCWGLDRRLDRRLLLDERQ